MGAEDIKRTKEDESSEHLEFIEPDQVPIHAQVLIELENRVIGADETVNLQQTLNEAERQAFEAAAVTLNLPPAQLVNMFNTAIVVVNNTIINNPTNGQQIPPAHQIVFTHQQLVADQLILPPQPPHNVPTQNLVQIEPLTPAQDRRSHSVPAQSHDSRSEVTQSQDHPHVPTRSQDQHNVPTQSQHFAASQSQESVIIRDTEGTAADVTSSSDDFSAVSSSSDIQREASDIDDRYGVSSSSSARFSVTSSTSTS